MLGGLYILGWVDIALFGISSKVKGWRFPWVQYGELPNFFDFDSKPVRATPLKVHNFKKSKGQKLK